ncbi:MAG: efflux RND transporter periplasmic adaptor subunit [bacterium]
MKKAIWISVVSIVLIGCAAGAIFVFDINVKAATNKSVEQTKDWIDQLRGIREPVTVRLAKAENGEITDIIVAEGATEPVHQVSVSTDMRNKFIDKVFVKVGDIVKKDDPLAEIGTPLEKDMLAASIVSRGNALATVRSTSTVLAMKETLDSQDLISKIEIEDARQSYLTAKSNLETANISVKVHEDMIAKGIVRAPMDGIVSAVFVDKGEFPKAVLFGVDSLQENFKAVVDEEMTGKVAIGQKAEVRIAAFPGKVFAGAVNKLDHSIKTDSRILGFTIWVTLPDLEAIVPGLSGYVKIQKSRRALTVPQTALIDFSGDRALVFVAQDSVAHVRPVVLGSASGGRREIVWGLEAGEMVITDGNDKVVDGDRVIITE